MKTPVIILGKGPTSGNVLQYYPQLDRGEMELWTLNDLRHPKATLHFELHLPLHHDVSDLMIPIVFHPHTANRELPARGLKFNEDKLNKLFDGHLQRGHKPFINNTISYMLVHNLLTNASPIILLGVDFVNPDETRKRERESLLYWIGIYHGLGVKILYPGHNLAWVDEIYN